MSIFFLTTNDSRYYGFENMYELSYESRKNHHKGLALKKFCSYNTYNAATMTIKFPNNVHACPLAADL